MKQKVLTRAETKTATVCAFTQAKFELGKLKRDKSSANRLFEHACKILDRWGIPMTPDVILGKDVTLDTTLQELFEARVISTRCFRVFTGFGCVTLRDTGRDPESVVLRQRFSSRSALREIDMLLEYIEAPRPKEVSQES